jgi:predicted cupin superfamily sugar epimerase
MKPADYWIDHLHLQPHPEGGFYKETYRSGETIPQNGLPARFPGPRSFSTAIYFLLRSKDRSQFHRIKSDELWHWHAGGMLSIYVLDQQGVTVHQLGDNLEKAESLQLVIPANRWFGAKLTQENSYVLASCTVAPGFDFMDFELADKKELIKQYPAHKEIVDLLTR